MSTPSIVHRTFVVEDLSSQRGARLRRVLRYRHQTPLVRRGRGQFFDGFEQPKQREAGCLELFDKLAEELKRSS